MNFKPIHMIKIALHAGEGAIEGHAACIDLSDGASRGKAVVSQVATELLPIGRFAEDLTGNGTRLVKIELFNPKRIHWFANSAASPVVVADIGAIAYFTAANEVGVPADPSALSTAGRVWIVETGRIGIETADAIGLQGPPGA